MKRLLLMGLLLTAIFNPTTQGALASSAYGALTIEGDNLTVEVRGVGVFNTPITLVLPVGNYTVSAEGQVKLEAKVFVNASKLVRVEFSTVEPDELVEGNLTILGVKVTYDWWKHYPKYSSRPSLGIPRGCGGAWSPFYYIDRPLPMTLEDAGDTIAKLTINNTITPCYLRSGIQDINGKLEYIFYTIAGPFGTSGIALKDTSFLTPLSSVEVSSDVELVNGYLYNVSSTSMVTPFTIILPVVTQDVYNVTGTTTDGDTITINHIPKTDTYNLSVGLNHTLVTAVVKPRPWEKYGISYSLRTALELIRVREESVELYGVRVNTTPAASFEVVGNAKAAGVSPGTIYLPEGNYTLTAFTNNSGVTVNFSVPETRELNLKLKPLPARLFFNVTPSNASVFIDGKPVNNRSVETSPGRHFIHVTAPGHVAENLSVLLAPNESRVLKIGLKPLPVLSVTTVPSGALVSIGNKTCRSPCMLALEPGRYTVDVSLEGYMNASKTAYLEPGKVVNVTITLEKVRKNAGTSNESMNSDTPTKKLTKIPAPAPSSGRNSYGTTHKLLALVVVILLTGIALRRR